jgi:hypothetical protein
MDAENDGKMNSETLKPRVIPSQSRMITARNIHGAHLFSAFFEAMATAPRFVEDGGFVPRPYVSGMP